MFYNRIIQILTLKEFREKRRKKKAAPFNAARSLEISERNMQELRNAYSVLKAENTRLKQENKELYIRLSRENDK